MKIRNDFVTNSSSSSFVISLQAKTKDGNSISVVLGDEEADDNINLRCNAEDIAKCSTVKELTALLRTSLTDNDTDDYADTDSEYDLEYEGNFKDDLLDFLSELEEDAKSIQDIDELSLTRIWSAWGEGCSCFDSNMEEMAPGLLELAQKAAQPDAPEEDIQAFKDYVNDFPGQIYSEWGGEFPSGFLGGTKAALVSKASPQEFAKKIISGMIGKSDYAEETTRINMQTGEITQTAEYMAD